jgi:two-component system chemotaxis response regulator CheY
MRVLICDDDASCRFVTKRMLIQGLGCTVAECADGVMALQMLARERFDMALIDLGIPKLDGVEVVEAIRDTPALKHLQIVVVSQERRERVVHRLLELGVHSYIVKPLRPEMVVAKIGPLAALATTVSHLMCGDPSRIRLDRETPALLVDGNPDFRHVFVSEASPYGPVIEASSGAEALASFRQSPVQIVFVGTDLGVLNRTALLRKIRAEVVDRPVRIIGLLDRGAVDEDTTVFDATINRSFVPSKLRAELKPFVNVAGPLALAVDAVPKLVESTKSAVTHAFGMMLALDVTPTNERKAEDTGGVRADVDLTIGKAFVLNVTLWMAPSAIRDTSARLLGCPAEAIGPAECLSTAQELSKLITGRMHNWLKENEIDAACSPPRTEAVAEGSRPADPSESDGFVLTFVPPEGHWACELSVSVQVIGEAAGAAA